MIYKAGDAIALTMLYVLLFLAGFLTDVCQCCETGYYSSKGECQKCPKNCASCRSASSCTLCHTGYYGETCSESCPAYCHNNECNQISGQCLSCIEGYYNDGNNSCSKCPENCATCYSKQVCFTCKSRYKGEYCQSVCSSCQPGTSCDKHTGYCLSECVDGFSGELCDMPCDSKCKSCNRYMRHECIYCASYRYGPSCNEQRCSKTCDLNTCDVSNGSCTFGCIAGYWGENCEHTCSPQCNNQVCSQSNGQCTDGCLKEFSGMDCSTNKKSILFAIIGGLIASFVVLGILSVYIFKIRKRRIKWCTSSRGESIHHLLSDKITKEPEAEPLKALNECKVNLNEDIEKTLDQTCEKENVNEGIFNQTLEPEEENKSRASDVSISMQGCPRDDIDVITCKTTLITQLKGSPEKQESQPLIYETAKPEKMINIVANKETFDMKNPSNVATHSFGKENANKSENKPDTSINIGNEGVYIDKPLEKQKEEPDVVRNTDENKNESNESLKDEKILKTPLLGKASTISKIPRLISLKKDENDNTSNFQGIEKNYNNNRVETFEDNKEEKMKINDKPTNNSIKVTELKKYVAAKPKSTFYTEFQRMSKDVSGTKLSGSVTSSTQFKVPQLGLPVILDDACKTTVYINANFIDDGSNDSKAYIAYMGSVAVISDDMEVFWKIVWQERCSTVVMLGRRSSPEEKCTCTSEPCSVEYHDLTVECQGEIKIDNFTVRKYTLRRQMMKEKVQHVQRLMFCGWPITGLPDVSSFVQFVKYANKVKLDGPTMVYCRFGIECTGTYIALDILTKQGKDTGWVDIQGCVRHLLEQRVNMLYNDKQYEFLHKALVCSLTSESSIET